MRTSSGFTIVELLIVIVVIGILAAIVIVSYNGVTNRAKDTERSAELSSIQKALELYYTDNGGYPRCPSGSGPNLAPYTYTTGTVTGCLTNYLVPKYMTSIPTDPVNDTLSYTYRYGAGYKKTGPVNFVGTTGNESDNYILGTKLNGVTSPTYSGWGYNDLTLLLGSSH